MHISNPYDTIMKQFVHINRIHFWCLEKQMYMYLKICKQYGSFELKLFWRQRKYL